MASSSYPVGAGTRVANDPQYEALAASWAAPGVVGAPTDTAVVFADGTGTRVVKIRANKRGNLRGWGWYSGATDFSMPSLAANAGGSDRYDTIVLRLSRSTYTVVEAVVQGAVGSALGSAALTQTVTEPLTTGTFEIPLAVVRVGPGVTAIQSTDVSNVAWYSSGPYLVTAQQLTSSVAMPYQPSTSIGIQRLRHYDTGFEFSAVSGSWQRMFLSNAGGLVAGHTFPGSGDGFFIFGSLADTGIRSGSAALKAGRRYAVEFQANVGQSASGDVVLYNIWDIRKNSLTSILGGEAIAFGTFPVYQAWRIHFTTEYEPAADETVDFQLWGATIKLSGTTLNWQSVRRGPGAFFRARDMGPANAYTAQ